ncbi:MAG: phosphopantothenate/pantothenate synthetase [Methanosarcinaceae archaeon]|nr:phosphopantothenate/pantothenate synthetase [Methanosarcinaceae archaeon]
MTEIPRSHPRYQSLLARELITQGVLSGITSKHGLIAQGRGEAFDYLIGEKTIDSAAHAETCACALLLLAENPVISVNGNAAALVSSGLVTLAEVLDAKLEVNLFHRTDERVELITKYLEEAGAKHVLGRTAEPLLDLDHERNRAERDGLYSADVVLVLLEDGDRCNVLTQMDKIVIAVDLNPLSRTSQTAHVSIVDNIVRVIPNMIEIAREMKGMDDEKLWEFVDSFDNGIALADAIEEIKVNLTGVQYELLSGTDFDPKKGHEISDEQKRALEEERIRKKREVLMKGSDLILE